MYLKRLELHGFKSFATKTEIEFLPGVSAIVGPNGSGKSNIAEAIQWVLGERSYRALRSLRSTDIIFAGSQRRKPMNIAEVALTFDNSDGAIPIGFSEVSISRRIYRSGECDYFINKTPCRLRDIHSLLLDIGLSADAFTLIGQNEVDAILAARPEERRELFEQVAGTERYHVRRMEAMRKLERTERNIIRLKDLRHELEAQLESIAQQAELARQYKELVERYRMLQMSLLGWEWGVRQRRLQRLSEEAELWSEQLSQIVERINQLEGERRGLESKLQELEEQLSDLRNQSLQAVEMTKSLEGEIELVKQRQRHIAERIEVERDELNRSLERRRSILNRLDEVHKRALELRGLFEECQREEGAVLNELSQVEDMVADKETEAESLRSMHIELMRLATSLRNKLLDYARTESALRARSLELEREAAEIGEQLKLLTASLNELSLELESIRGRREEVQAKLRNERQLHAELERVSDELCRKAATMRELLSGLRARLNALEENEAALHGVREGPRNVLMASRNGQLPPNYQLVAHLLKVPSELEIAVAAALGGAIEYIVAHTMEDVRVAIEYLKHNHLGRATFLTPDFIRLRQRHSDEVRWLVEELKGNGIIGWACELVGAVDGYEVIRDYLLGNVLIVREFADATELGMKANSSVRIVTLEGELIIPRGPISGGYEAHSLHILFSRRREIEELRNRIREVSAKLQRCEHDLRANLSEIERRRDAIGALSGELSELAERWTKVEAEHSAMARRFEQLSKRLEVLRAEQKRVEDERHQIANETESIRAQLGEAEGKALELEKKISVVMAHAGELIKARDELRSRLSDVRTRLVQLSEKLSSAQSEEEELSQLLEETNHRILLCENAIASFNEQLKELSALLSQLEVRRKQLQQSCVEAEGAFEQWRQYRRELLSQIDSVDAELQKLNEDKSAIEAELSKIGVRRAEARSEGDEIARRLIEEFSVSPQDALRCAEELQNKQAAAEELSELKRKIEQLGQVNISVIDEYERLKERVEYLEQQGRDLENARENLLSIIRQVDVETRAHLISTIAAVEREFQNLFSHAFGGGEVKITLTDSDDLTHAGVEVKVRLPGRAVQDLLALSGGERAMTAICLLFAMLAVRPVPFCVLDEVDAALDDNNVSKFAELLKEFSRRSQFIVITHNQGTLEVVDQIYGVTMGEDGVSEVLSLSLEEATSVVE